MTSQPSSSDHRPSSAFDKFHPEVQRWIYDHAWTELREIQELAAEPILTQDKDVILAAPTAGGKTEAAFLPICSRIASDPQPSIEALYVSPLKALINDQFARLDSLCERLDIPVHRWHGDVSSYKKHKVLRDPRGILLITPESLEALFILRGPAIPQLFRHLSYVVIDELHSFIGSERGRQLQSLLHRIELAVRRGIPRIGLSATLGNMELAADFLRPGKERDVTIQCSGDGSQEIKLQVRGYIKQSPPIKDSTATPNNADGDTPVGEDVFAIARHLLTRLRGSNNLVFCNSRQAVETYADLLRRMCEREGVPNEFFPHHGNLSKELREDLESRLREAQLPVNAVCTTTLELGIDIGAVSSIAQIGPPFSVAAMRQRLGRSGRRGEPAVMRLYIQETPITVETPPQDALRMDLVQAIAMVALLIHKWYEPPSDEALHLSTLIQQSLSVIAQHGGAKAKELWRALCQSGPFRSVSESMFAELLHSLGRYDLITQSHDDTLVLGLSGEALVNHYEFYTAFTTPEEYRVSTAEKTLGAIPLEQPVIPGMYIVFAGRRWEVMLVEERQRLIVVKPAAGGRPPKFGGTGGTIHGRIREEMFQIYQSRTVPHFLDSEAARLLAEGRETFHRFGLDHRSILEFGKDAIVFPWAGDRVVNTIAVQLSARDQRVFISHGTMTVSNVSRQELSAIIQDLVGGGPADPIALATRVPHKLSEKHDVYLPGRLLDADYAARLLDIKGAWETLNAIQHRY